MGWERGVGGLSHAELSARQEAMLNALFIPLRAIKKFPVFTILGAASVHGSAKVIHPRSGTTSDPVLQTSEKLRDR